MQRQSWCWSRVVIASSAFWVLAAATALAAVLLFE
jgi:hypothetical protein